MTSDTALPVELLPCKALTAWIDFYNFACEFGRDINAYADAVAEVLDHDETIRASLSTATHEPQAARPLRKALRRIAEGNLGNEPLTAPPADLLACPFCGSSAIVVERHNPLSKWKFSVDCRSGHCGMSGPVESSREKAIAAWNTRALSATRTAVTELKMTPISDGLPVRDEMRGEQTILTYNDRVGVWGIDFMEAGWDDYDAGFALGVSHWLDITSMWPGVIAQVQSYAAPPITTEGE